MKSLEATAKVFGRGVGRTSVSETQLQKGFPTTSDIRLERSFRHQPILTASASYSLVKLISE